MFPVSWKNQILNSRRTEQAAVTHCLEMREVSPRPVSRGRCRDAAAFCFMQRTESRSQTAQTLQNYSFRALQVARTYYRDLMEIVVGAHKLLCGVVPGGDNSLHGNRGEDTFRAWCASVHISKTKAYQLLQIQDFMDSCTPEQQSTLALLPFTAMRELVTSDTPEQVITMAKEGKVGTSKEVLELKAQLKAEKDRANAAEAQLEAVTADVQGLSAENEILKKRVDQAEQECMDRGTECLQATARATKAEARAKDAENQLAGARQVAQAAKLRGDKLKAENDALKSQPINAVVDEEEVDRRAGEKAYQMAADMTAELQAKLNATAGDAEQDARNAYDGILLANRAIINTWQIARPLFRKLPEEQREALANQIARTIGNIQGEVTKCL